MAICALANGDAPAALCGLTAVVWSGIVRPVVSSGAGPVAVSRFGLTSGASVDLTTNDDF